MYVCVCARMRMWGYLIFVIFLYIGVWVIYPELWERIQLILTSLWQGNNLWMDKFLVIG